ncbi:DeoR family transcriptional regulator [Burkholderiaceae bacterium DAT-1]|nr:DeoR family transcriptional regulator [Burkholderiaceae bacterium DAT-1]
MKKTSQRREIILNHLIEHGSVEVSDLVARFNVSAVTIRNDLAALEEKGLITRAYGGAYFNRAAMVEQSVAQRDAINHPVKARIGAEAARLVGENETIIIDAGSTTLQLAKHLKNKSGVTVMTNGLNVAAELADAEGVEVMITGGNLRKKSMSFQGPQAEASFDHYRFNKLFLGVDGLDINYGITTHNADEAMLNRRMAEVSGEIIAITDSSKVGKICLHKIVGLDRISMLITDDGLDPQLLKAMNDMGLKVVMVPKD